MIHLWRRSLAARFIGIILLSLILSQAAAFVVSWDERGQVLRSSAKGEMLSRTAALVRVLETTPPALLDDILRASNFYDTRFWVSPEAPGEVSAWRAEALRQLAQPLPRVAFPGAPTPPEARIEPLRRASGVGSARWLEVSPSAWPISRPARYIHLDDDNGMGVAVRLDNGLWLNSVFAKPGQGSFWNSQTVTSLTISALVLSVIAVFAARGIAQPLRRLARAAEALGRGQQITPLPESGPDDIRHTAEAFNRMQERLLRFVEDRTRMLAAIGHDLRTPLTSLRLRAEFIADEELRGKILGTITEIQSMCEASLAFVREEGAAEETRTVDLSALVESMCEDLAELGHKVTFVEAPKVGYRCRPASLRRACRNLVENAVRYGECAIVRIERIGNSIDIVVEDEGPGIPEAAREQVFAPFFRLEGSRNRETGGLGLGLAIARTIARHHGGDVFLVNQPRGLKAVLSLPAMDGESGASREVRAPAVSAARPRLAGPV